MPQQTVSRWEAGSNVPSRRVLSALAHELRLDPDRLFRLGGYYVAPMRSTGCENSFDAAISDMAHFTDDQLMELVDRAWRHFRLRKIADVGDPARVAG